MEAKGTRSEYDHGPLQDYEITWASGRVEVIQGHQVTFQSGWLERVTAPKVHVHGQYGSKWRLVLSAPEDDIRTIRWLGDSVLGDFAVASADTEATT